MMRRKTIKNHSLIFLNQCDKEHFNSIFKICDIIFQNNIMYKMWEYDMNKTENTTAHHNLYFFNFLLKFKNYLNKQKTTKTYMTLYNKKHFYQLNFVPEYFYLFNEMWLFRNKELRYELLSKFIQNQGFLKINLKNFDNNLNTAIQSLFNEKNILIQAMTYKNVENLINYINSIDDKIDQDIISEINSFNNYYLSTDFTEIFYFNIELKKVNKFLKKIYLLLYLIKIKNNYSFKKNFKKKFKIFYVLNI